MRKTLILICLAWLPLVSYGVDTTAIDPPNEGALLLQKLEDNRAALDAAVDALEAATSNIDNTADLNKPVSTATQTALNLKANSADPALTGVVNLGAVTSLEIPNSTTPTTDATGEIALDTSVPDHKPMIQYYTGSENMTVIAIPTADISTTDDFIIKYDAATNKFTMEADAGGGGGSWGSITGTLSSQTDLQNALDAKLAEDGGTVTGVNIGDYLMTLDTLSGTAIDTDDFEEQSISAATTYTFGSTPTSGQVFGLRITTDGTARLVTIPSSYSLGQLAAITSFTIPASSTVDLRWHYDGTTYFLSGENAPLSYSDLTDDKVYSESFTLAEPDQLQGISDNWVLKHFIAEEFPNGATITSIHVSSSASSSDTYNFEESSSPTGSSPSTVESVALSSATEAEDDGTFSDADIASDGYLLVDLDDSSDDISYATITFSYTID